MSSSKVKLLHRVGLGAVGQAGEEARHGQAEYRASSESRSERQAAYSGVWKIFVRSRGLLSSCQDIHAQQLRRGGGDERRVRGGGDLRHAAEHLHIRRRVIEVIIADEAAVGLAAGRAEFLFVKLLEERALVPGRALELLERLPRSFLEMFITRIFSFSSVSVLLTR